MKVVIVGVSGYIGGEVLRLLLGHPHVRIGALYGSGSAGRRVSDEHPGLEAVCDLPIRPFEEAEWDGIEAAFLCLPSGESMKVIRHIPESVCVIDTAPDFRLCDRAVYERTYSKHSAWDRQQDFVYGLPEIFRAEIRKARSIAAPGCFATAAILGIYPLLAAGLSRGPFFVSAVTGSSGSGSRPRETTHHPFRADSLFAYGMFTHRHIPEIEQALADSTGTAARVILQPHSGPFVRSILATVFTKLDARGDPRSAFEQAYGREPFIRLRNTSPNVKWVRQTNFADISVHTDGEYAVVIVAIDNLVKGGGGQAIQAMNIRFGLPETAGLRLAGGNP